MDIQFNNLKQEKGAIGITFCDHNCKLIGYGKKLDQLSKKHLSNTINADESLKARKSKNFDYLIIHNPQNLYLSKLYIFKLNRTAKKTLIGKVNRMILGNRRITYET